MKRIKPEKIPEEIPKEEPSDIVESDIAELSAKTNFQIEGD